jgi:choline transport protein
MYDYTQQLLLLLTANKMSEEIQNASRVVPWATICSILVNGLLGFGMVIAILFSLGDDVKGVLKTPYSYPFLQIFMNSTRSRAATTGLASLLLSLIFFSMIGLVATTSRMMWSFARDRGLPGWRTLSKVRRICTSRNSLHRVRRHEWS